MLKDLRSKDCLVLVIALLILGVVFAINKLEAGTTSDNIWLEVKTALNYVDLAELPSASSADSSSVLVPEPPPIAQTELPASFPVSFALPPFALEPVRITPHKVMLIGDSMMMEGLGPKLEKELEKLKLNVSRKGKYSSGLAINARINWTEEAPKYIGEFKPDVVISILGTNDGQKIVNSKGTNLFGSEGWVEAYRSNVRDYLKAITNASEPQAKIYVLGQPIPQTEDFQKKFRLINSIQAEVAKDFPSVEYVSTWERFSLKGKFSNVIADDKGKRANVKFADGIHLTSHGAKIMSDLIISEMSKDMEIR